MALEFNMALFIALLAIFIILTILRVVYTIPLIKYLKEKHNEVYLRYSPKNLPISSMFIGYMGLKINRDLMFTNKLKLDDVLIKNIVKFRLIAYLHIASLLSFIIYAYVFLL